MNGWKAKAAALRRPRDRRPGPSAWAVAVSLQELRTHLQRPDQDAAGASAQGGASARSRPGDDRGQEPAEDRRTVRRSFRRRPSVGGIGFSARPNVEGDRRSRRDLHPRIVQGPLVRPAAQGAQTGRNGIRTTSPSSSPATGRARPSMRSCFRSTALQWEARSPASSRRPTISSATAGRRSPLSPAKPGFRCTPCRRRANQPPRRPTPHQQRQRLPLPSYLGWRRALEAWGDQLAPQSGSGAPSETAHTNSERYKSQNVRERYDQQDRRLHEGACRGE
jgi:hypothetical protein